ncbi:MAG: efflux RND transporter periplasmic adaptor subunit [Rhodocyclaceae bacterium]
MQVQRTAWSALLALTLAACGSGNKNEGEKAAQGASAEASAPASQSGPAAGGDRGARPQAVTTVKSRIESVPVVLSAQGNVLPIDEVDVRTQKTGTVAEIHVREGQEVGRGALLFSLDDREDVANVRKAEATLAGTQAQIVIAERELARNTDLFNQKFVSSATVDTSRNKLETLQSTLEQNRAALEQVKVVLSYSKIKAPFAGRVGRIDVRPGSLVQANATTAMVKITRLDPIAVSFSLPERDLTRLQAALDKGTVPVQVDVPGQRDESVKGRVIFVESTVDKISGTIGVKAEVSNSGRKLWPGQYVTVRASAGMIDDALVLPPQAIVNGPNNRFVYIVNEDMTVKQQPVDLVRIAGRNAIVKGIDPDVKVVLEGAANLRPGSKVFEVKGNGERGGGRRGGGDQSGPAAEGKGGDKAGGEKSGGEKADADKAGGKPAGEKSTGKPAASGDKAAAKPAGKGIVIPEGFTPRDPERFAGLSDEEKLKVIERWRERRAAGGGQ